MPRRCVNTENSVKNGKTHFPLYLPKSFFTKISSGRNSSFLNDFSPLIYKMQPSTKAETARYFCTYRELTLPGDSAKGKGSCDPFLWVE